MRSNSPLLPGLTKLSLALLSLALLAACPPSSAGHCDSDNDCGDAQICLDGSCVDNEAPVSCASDEECDAARGESCIGGVCAETPPATPCLSTNDCQLDEYCDLDVGSCAPLPAGWCRIAEQCGSSAPVCSAQTQAVAGRCVECLSDDHCSSGRCVSPGICEGGSPLGSEEPSTPCTENAHETAPGVCICDDGFVSGGDGRCVPGGNSSNDGNGSGGGNDLPTGDGCPPHASPNTNGLCVCDDGYELASNGSSCVLAGSGGNGSPSPSGGVPAGWTCPDYFATDLACDCGCSVPDPACESGSAGVCDYDQCEAGTAPVDGQNHLCEEGGGGVPAGWTCPIQFYSDNYCDCGCGVKDPACPSLSASVCDFADCDYGDPVVDNDNTQCASGNNGTGGGEAGTWVCPPVWYGDGECDCGCGIVDEDCGSQTASCDYSGCNDGYTSPPDNNTICVPE